MLIAVDIVTGQCFYGALLIDLNSVWQLLSKCLHNQVGAKASRTPFIFTSRYIYLNIVATLIIYY